MKTKILSLIILLCSISSVYAKAKTANAIWYFFAKTSTSVTENEDISVVYDIYTVGCENPSPKMRIMITNKSNRIIYIDLGTSFFKKNNVASVIYTPTVSSTMNEQSSGASINLGSVANAVGIGGTIGTVMGGINIGGGKSSSTTMSTSAQRYISIPPTSTVFLEDIPIEKALGKILYYTTVGLGNHVYRSPKYSDLERGEIIDFTEENTMFTTSCFFNYSFTDNFKETKYIETTYYVKKIVGSFWNTRALFRSLCYMEYKILDETFPQWRDEVKSGNLKLIRLWAK